MDAARAQSVTLRVVETLGRSIVGQDDDPITQAMLRAAAKTGLGTLVLLQLEPGQPLPAMHPAFGKSDVNRPTAYLCQGQTCGLPVYDALSLTRVLQGES